MAVFFKIKQQRHKKIPIIYQSKLATFKNQQEKRTKTINFDFMQINQLPKKIMNQLTNYTIQ